MPPTHESRSQSLKRNEFSKRICPIMGLHCGLHSVDAWAAVPSYFGGFQHDSAVSRLKHSCQNRWRMLHIYALLPRYTYEYSQVPIMPRKDGIEEPRRSAKFKKLYP